MLPQKIAFVDIETYFHKFRSCHSGERSDSRIWLSADSGQARMTASAKFVISIKPIDKAFLQIS